MEDIDRVLHKYWGNSFQLRSHQPEIVRALVAERDVLALLPTGEGKSLCYQLAGLVLGGMTLVISPLIALMQDQVQSLKAKGLPVVHLHGRLSRHEREQALLRCLRTGGFVYLSPEQLQGAQLRAFFWQHPPRLVVVDEAHCISLWGHDFRPAYRRIPDFVSHLRQRPILGAFTATAPRQVAQDIVQVLALKDPLQVRGIPLQPHIRLQIARAWTPRGHWQTLKAGLRDKTLIYAATRQGTETLAKALQAESEGAGQTVFHYHAGCSARMRQQVLESFSRETKGIMVATKAFGMGVDIPDIQRVIHWQLPESLSAYVQEVGRAGRNRQGEASGLLLQLWGEKSPAEQLQQPLRAEQIRLVLRQLLQAETALHLLIKRFQLSEAQLYQIILPLEQAGVLFCEGQNCRLQSRDFKALFRLVTQNISLLQKRRQQDLREMRAYLRHRGCRRHFLYQAFALEPDAPCGACDRCRR